MNPTRRSVAAMATIVTATAGLLAGSGLLAGAANAATTFIGPLNQTTQIASTVPANGDQNPYGVAVVPRSTGDLHRGDVLVSNFNNAATTANPGGVQGTGTTIVQVSPGGAVSQFAGISDRACPGGVGLTTALVVLRSGWVIVGSLPTMNGSVSGAGCLIVLDSHGVVRETLAGHGINGPWDMTALDLGGITELFVTNVLNGTVAAGGNTVNGGTVLRLLITSGPFGRPRLLAVTRIGSGFPETLNNAALVIGPTGVGLGRNGTLYVADTLANRIAAIPNATLRFTDDGPGRTVSAGGSLNGELGLAIAPNGDILTVNANDGNIVEVTPGGAQTVKTLIPNGAGDLFGLAVKPDAAAVYFVNDGNNTLNLFH
jgi:hypothetical protein